MTAAARRGSRPKIDSRVKPIACDVNVCKRLAMRKVEGFDLCSRPTVWCDDCDGCGWVEGGKTLQTPCSACGGAAVVHG